MFVFFFVFLVALGITLWGRGRFQKIYRQERENVTACGITGAELADRILRQRHIEGVAIQKGRGMLDDFYLPEKRVVTLSPEHYSGTSYSALAIAAQQAGKAIQHHEGHRPLMWRTSSIRWTVYLSVPILLASLVALALGMNKTVFPMLLLAWSVIAMWNVATIPTELDAGERAKRQLEDLRVFRNLDERVGVERVMGAASTAYLDGFHTVFSWAMRTAVPWAKRQMNPEEK